MNNEMGLEEYKKNVVDYLIKNMGYSLEMAEQSLLKYKKIIEDCYQKGWKITSVAAMIFNEL